MANNKKHIDSSNNKTKEKTRDTLKEKITKKSKNNSDPHAKREAKKYDNPIASREFILERVKKSSKPLTFTHLIDLLSISSEDEEQFDAIKRRLRAMVRDGQIVQTRKGTYGIAQKMELIKGRVSANAGGFGFLIPEEGGDDLFLSPGQMKALFDGDIILAKVSGIDRRGRKEGRVEEILERNTKEVVGRCFVESGVRFLNPESKKINHDILIGDSDHIQTSDGQFVVAEIIRQPDYRSPAIAKIVEVLGEHMAPGMEIDVAIRSHQLPHRWSEDVEQAIEKIPNEITESEINKRVDLRNLNFVTIDGEDARDFDDAIFCQPSTISSNKKGWSLSVAIADVANYVESNSALDIEALNRGNSVYFPKRVIPMLPEKLSNGLCSLNPKQDRLTLVCQMEVDSQGELLSYQFMEACIHSKARLTYTEVAKFLDNGEISEALKPVTKDIKEFYNLYHQLKIQRDKRGAINVESTESRFIFNEEKKIEAVVPVIRNVAHQMIEEAMLLANICAAKILQANELPALYRVHDAPTDEKLNDLKDYLQPLGFRFSASGEKGGGIRSAHFQEVIAFSQGRPDQELINTIVLRSMQQAIYSPQCSEHFGLAYEEYAHFTSPIRRYPDLIVHRALKYLIRTSKTGKSVVQVKGAKALTKKEMLVEAPAELNQRAQHVSFTERRADLATRDAVDWLKCEFMLDKVGETFTGKIASVTGFGLFVLLDDIYIEGLIHISELKNDYYQYDDRRHELKAEHSQQVFRLADKVKVQVARVSLDEKKIEFLLLDENGEQIEEMPRRKSSPGSKGKDSKSTKGKRGEKSKGKAAKAKTSDDSDVDKTPKKSKSKTNKKALAAKEVAKKPKSKKAKAILAAKKQKRKKKSNAKAAD
jgi:ribonuclease R